MPSESDFITSSPRLYVGTPSSPRTWYFFFLGGGHRYNFPYLESRNQSLDRRAYLLEFSLFPRFLAVFEKRLKHNSPPRLHIISTLFTQEIQDKNEKARNSHNYGKRQKENVDINIYTRFIEKSVFPHNRPLRKDLTPTDTSQVTKKLGLP